MRAERRRATERAIHLAALRLTDAHGLDGFTVDELAAAAGVSRRTLFNYFPGKLDAVLGPEPELTEEVLAVFRAGGPTGRLADDLGTAARDVLSAQGLGREEIELGRRVLLREPRLLAAAHARFEEVAEDLAEHLLAREGADFGAERARLLLHVCVSLYDASLLVALRQPAPEVDLGEAFVTSLQTLRELLA